MFDSELVKAFEELETPFYFYDLSVLRQTLQTVSDLAQKHDFSIHYALKANSNPDILNVVREFGLGADCVSGGEVAHALEMGFEPSEVVFAGVGKSDKEIELAIENDIFCFNCESAQEMEIINEIAEKMGKKARIALRLNPNVKADTHHYISTGSEENKFGISEELWGLVIEKLKTFAYIDFVGIHFHIGSQIRELNNFKNLCERVNQIQDFFEQKGLFIEHLNLGGGLGINYQNPEEVADFEAYFDTFAQNIQKRDNQKIHFELGRSIVANCGSLISRVLYIKEGVYKKFVILDAGMTELIRPALYQAYHHIQNISSQSTEKAIYDVVGPICESSDSFIKNYEMPITKRHDLVAIRSAGAYGEVMSSYYNLREKAKQYYKD